jgi:hypothetical protein
MPLLFYERARAINAMAVDVAIIAPTSPDFPLALRYSSWDSPCSQLWAIGNLGVLKTRLLGSFCATRCPGNVIVLTQAVHRFHLVHNLRQGYGRAGFALIRQRVLQAA